MILNLMMNGYKAWWLNGELHREDGPAIEYHDGGVEWHFNGSLHRKDGPAIDHADGNKEWWLNGHSFTIDIIISIFCDDGGSDPTIAWIPDILIVDDFEF